MEANLGTVIRELRGAMSQKELAERAGTPVSHLCRIETGKRDEVSRDLLDRLADALGDSYRLPAAAGMMLPSAERAILRYPRALSRDTMQRRSLPALRRAEAATRAEELRERLAPGAVSRGRVDHREVCRAAGLRLDRELSVEPGPPVEFRGIHDGVVVVRTSNTTEPDAGLEERYLAAHAAAHAWDGGERRCSLPRLNDAERLASDMAGFILAPSDLLQSAVQLASSESRDQQAWSSRFAAGVAGRVSRDLAVPLWVAIQRISEESLLESPALAAVAPR